VWLSHRDSNARDRVTGENRFRDSIADPLEKLWISGEDGSRFVVKRAVIDDGLGGRFDVSLVPDGDVDFDRLRVLALMGEDTDARVKAHRAESDRFTG
jgi:hypothetical protein